LTVISLGGIFGVNLAEFLTLKECRHKRPEGSGLTLCDLSPSNTSPGCGIAPPPIKPAWKSCGAATEMAEL
jgi:hypothetical protein